MKLELLEKKAAKIHSEIMTSIKLTLDRGIELGGILLEIKGVVGFGHFQKIIKKRTKISIRAAQNYMSIYTHRDLIKKAKIETLVDAYKLIANFKNNLDTQKRTERRAKRAAFANLKTKVKNPNGWEDQVICGDNIKVMQDMLDKGLAGKFTLILTSPPYNCNTDYGVDNNGKKINDNLSYEDYLKFLLSAFPYYIKLLRSGGRCILNLGNMVVNEERNTQGDYNHQILVDLKYEVRKQFKELRHFTDILWFKGEKGKSPLKTQFGTYMKPELPVPSSIHENIIVWSKDKFSLDNIEGTTSDITKEEFEICKWSVWTVAPCVPAGSLHQCSFPKKLVELLTKYFSYPNDMVLDPFCGQGTVGEVCKKNRRFTLIDINPNYVSLARKNIEKAQ